MANAPFKEMRLPSAMATVQVRLSGLVDGDRQMVSLLLAAHELGIDAVETACAEALDAGLRSADMILNILSHHRQEIIADPIVAPAHLQLREEPIADCARYDRLIEGEGLPATGSRARPNAPWSGMTLSP